MYFPYGGFQMKDSKLNLEKMNDFVKTANSDHPEMVSAGQKAAAVCAEKGEIQKEI